MPAPRSERIFEHLPDWDAQSFCSEEPAEANAEASVPDVVRAKPKHVVTLTSYSADQFEVIVFNGRGQWTVHRSYGDFVKLHRAMSVNQSLAPLPRTPKLLVRDPERKYHQRYEALSEFLRAALRMDPGLQRAELRRFIAKADESAADDGQFLAAVGSRMLRCFSKRSSASLSTAASDGVSLGASLDEVSELVDQWASTGRFRQTHRQGS